MIPQRRKFFAASLAGIGLAGFMQANVQASELEGDPLENLQVASISMEEIQQSTSSGVASLRSQSTEDSPVNQYLESQARSGNLVDIEQVNSAKLMDPLESGSIDLVWVDGLSPAEVNRSEISLGEDQSQSGLGVAMAQDQDQDQGRDINPGRTGMGYESATSNGMRLHADDCWGGYFNSYYASVADNDHNMVSCYEKWAESGTRQWAYNRWGIWSKASPLLGSAATIDLTLRSRPWEGMESRISKLNKWVPTSPSSQCNPGGSFDLTYYGAGLNVDIDNCEDMSVLPEIGEKSMGIDWDGSSTRQQMALDFAMHITATNDTIIPMFADYMWAEVRNCGVIPCNPTQIPTYKYVHTDSGW